MDGINTQMLDAKVEYAQDKCIYHLFEKQVEQTPDAVALVFTDGQRGIVPECKQQLTYRELNARVNQLAHYLQKLGVGLNVLVGIYVERSIEMVVGLLGILKAGGAYVPLDPAYPQERLAFILEDAQVKLLLTQQRLLEKIPKQQAEILCIDSDWEIIAANPCENPTNLTTAENLAYVIYTSGSTGKPKGVLINHGNIVRLFTATQTYFQFNQQDVWTLFHSFAFDFSVWEIWGALIYGGRLVIVPYWVSRSPEAFYKLLYQEQVTVLNQTPSAFQQLLRTEETIANPHNLALRWVIFGGEAVNFPALKPWFARHGDKSPRLVNMYGITETTVHVTYRPITMADVHGGTASLIGSPIPDLQVYILDEKGESVSEGIPGEMYVGGAGVAVGYLNRPELTTQRFIPHPFSSDPQARLYKTGDLARYLGNGDLEYLGRIDHQVKIRGFRIELGEIEAVLSQHPAVEQTIVIVREDIPGDKRLVAYIVTTSPAVPTHRELRRFVQEQLPDYMVPSAFVFLDTLPLTTNGKVDRRALPAPNIYSATLDKKYVAPSNNTEEYLAAIWSQLLGIEKVGIHDNFFELGGHSLLASQVISRIYQALTVEISLQLLFEHPTVATLAKAIAQCQHQGVDVSASQAIPVRENRDWAPLSFAQQRLWFFDQLEANSAFYNIPEAVRLRGDLNIKVLQTALSVMVVRHEALRTTFTSDNGNPIQVINPPRSVELAIIDLQQYGETEQETQVHQWLHQESQRCFNLESDQMLRGCLLQLAPQEHILLLVMHHIASDGWSMGILWQELGELYQGYLNGKPNPLPTLPIQYGDFAVWQRQWLSQEILDKQLHYWKQQLAGANPLLELPTDRPRPPVQTYRGASQWLQIPPTLTASLHQLCRQQGVTLYMTLLAAFQTLLYRYSTQEEIIVGSPIAGRNRRETESLIGFFVNTLVLRTDLSGNPSFQELLQRVRQVALAAYSHQDLPFEKLVEELNPERSLSYHPLFQVMFVLQNSMEQEDKLLGLTATPVEVNTATAKFDLVLSVQERDGVLVTTWEYNTDLFDAATITRMSGHFQTLLAGIVTNPQQSIATLPLLTAAEQQQLLKEWNQTYTEYPRNKCIHQLFEEQVECTPDAIALVFEEQQLTYRELNTRANQLAHYLQKLGVKPDVLVGICVERSLEMVVGLLGILKAGGTYVPLDSKYPQERLNLMLSDSQVSVLLTQQKLLTQLPEYQGKVVCLDTYWRSISQEDTDNPISKVKADHLAYICYTSGSTGKPKGVAIPHRGVVRLVKGTDYINFSSQEVFLQLAPISFDASTLEIWGSLLNGAKLVIMPAHTPSLEELAQVIQGHQVSTLWLTAGLFHLMVDQRLEDLKPVGQLLAGGDVLSVTHVQKVLRELPACRLINGYGPTENTTFTCCYTITEPTQNGNSIPIGRAIANTQVYILDSHLQPLPIGVPGELYIGGDGLARGYLNRPQLNSEKFIPNPFSNQSGECLYKTGDKGRYLSDGNIEFLNRIDNQVKIRGFRIELGEIEAVLSQHPAVEQTVVIVREDIPGEKRLVAYVVNKSPVVPTNRELHGFLEDKLPDYMVPSAFVILDVLPLTPNGKVDRQNLPIPNNHSYQISTNFVAPRHELELRLTNIWEKNLGVKPISIKDNFFELGGHSLLALRLWKEVETLMEKKIPLTTLFQFPTIEQLAKVLQEQGWQPRCSSLIVIKSGGEKPPLFCIHVLGRGLEFYRPLAAHLSADQPLYGLTIQVDEDNQGQSLITEQVEDLAAYYIRDMKSIQQQGPYLLAGVSFGGLVAFEMAQQLTAQGEEVALLALFDTIVPGAQKKLSWQQQLLIHSQKLSQMGLSYLSSTVIKKVSCTLQGYREKINRLLNKISYQYYENLGCPIPEHLLDFSYREANNKALRNYQPSIYSGCITLFRATDRSEIGTSIYLDPCLGWQELAEGGLNIYDIPSSHLGMLRDPETCGLVEKLQTCIEESS